MHNGLKRLEEQINGARELIGRLKEENDVLKKQIELLGAARNKAFSNTAAARELADFRAKVRRRLERICARIEKDNDLQPALFEDDDAE
ncbi:MAG: hypothetical protein Q7R35_19800 [Elusimicrobiota bacterium]|nr:hypothetical protein [Elusimicrobiota bacterium]